MTLDALRDDALRPTAAGFALHLGLPWIRSLPLASLRDLTVAIDGTAVTELWAERAGRPVSLHALRERGGWWFLQDRLVIRGDRMLPPGAHRVSVSFGLAIPYLQTGPDGPLVLPFRIERELELTPDAPTAVVEDGTRGDASPPVFAATEWALAASAFNWTPEVIRADRAASDIAVSIVADGVAPLIEIEPGQLWRSFPEPADDEVDRLRERLNALGGAVTILGGSIDDWGPTDRRRSDDERMAFLVPQLRAAARLGARGVRVPFGQPGGDLLRRLQPILAELDVVLFEEIQGQQTLDLPANAANLEVLTTLDDPRIRVLIDISMLMPSLPPTYLARMRSAGLPTALLDRLAEDWRSAETHAAVLATLRAGEVPPAVHTLFMDLLVRFGRSTISDLEPLLPLTSGVHLKFWDLDDTDARVSGPIADIGGALRAHGFTGTLTSEWGGHEWLDDDPTTMTRDHLALARRALNGASR